MTRAGILPQGLDKNMGTPPRRPKVIHAVIEPVAVADEGECHE
jgi:hypothetical protein